MAIKGHPIYKLKSRLLRGRPDLVLQFSRYIYSGPGITLSRRKFSVLGTEINDVWLDNQIAALRPEEELALHSKVIIASTNRVRHIPMIDFVEEKNPGQIQRRVANLSMQMETPLVLFDSGRSLHGYFYELITEVAWRKYLGDLLLINLNSKSSTDIVDSRWVGHSLEQGFTALRWSRNTAYYRGLPREIE